MSHTLVTPPQRQPDTAAGHDSRPRMLALIALYKLAKAVACIVLAATAFDLVRPDVALRFGSWLESLSWANQHGIVMRAIDWLLGLGPHQYRVFGSVALIYATLFAVQGIGLWFMQRWAEYLVVIETCLLLPFEIWELQHRFTPLKLGVLAVNVAVVVYLIRILRRHVPAEVR